MYFLVYKCANHNHFTFNQVSLTNAMGCMGVGAPRVCDILDTPLSWEGIYPWFPVVKQCAWNVESKCAYLVHMGDLYLENNRWFSAGHTRRVKYGTTRVWLSPYIHSKTAENHLLFSKSTITYHCTLSWDSDEQNPDNESNSPVDPGHRTEYSGS